MKFFDLFGFAFVLSFLRLNFGGGSSSKQDSRTTTNNTNNVSDNRVVADGGAIVAGAGATVNTTDLGAVQKSADLAQAAIVGATALATSAQAQAGAMATKSLEESQKSMLALKGAYEMSSKSTLIMAGAVALLLWITNGKKSK